jgi:hypothetical protein
MNNMKKYVERFFDDLQVFEDSEHGHCYKIFIKQAVLEFLNNETKETAFFVYRTFFDSYRIVIQDETNPFIDLLDVLKNYEENASTLIDRQRDHYIHSVNVFILGLCIYAQNAKYREAFRATVMDKNSYPYSYNTKNEEFFYRWGLASLFHDVGYPVEIVGRQINKFMDFVTDVDRKSKRVNVQLTSANFTAFNQIAEVIPKREFTKYLYERYDDSVYIDPLKPVDLLAHKLHTALGVDPQEMKSTLDNFVNVMALSGFIDHGYYSAIIVLKWYGYLIQSANYKPEYFFEPVLDSAGAILLHNCYKNMLQKKPHNLGTLSPFTYPIAFLLILCDELQEWNREAYGMKDKLRTLAAQVKLDISDKAINVTFVTLGGSLTSDFARGKKRLLYRLLAIGDLFDRVSIRCKTLNKTILPPQPQVIEPRPRLCDLEKLARAIHELYNEKQQQRYPDKPLRYTDFDRLTDSLKYSNLRQAMDIPEKLFQMGYAMCPASKAAEPVVKFPKEYVEYLAEKEHEAWVAERKATGWISGEVVDAEKKTTPYLIAYKKLPEEIKQLDRDPVENIPALLSIIGFAVIKRHSLPVIEQSQPGAKDVFYTERSSRA